jgi:hypothetical protein
VPAVGLSGIDQGSRVEVAIMVFDEGADGTQWWAIRSVL